MQALWEGGAAKPFNSGSADAVAWILLKWCDSHNPEH
jgi:hypothetical protein